MNDKLNIQKQAIPLKKKILFSLIVLVSFTIIIVLLLELIMSYFYPKSYLYPRLMFSPEYGTLLYPNTTMEHVKPPNKRIYTTNKYGIRGKLIPISNSYKKNNIILLGDSYTFGIGVNDGEEFASILSENLSEYYDVINTGVGGWGLTQQIRRFYEFGQLYYPKIVILVFCGNDPRDNLKNRVTLIDNGRFKFKKSNSSINWVKKYLSKSIIQKSNLYQLFRHDVYLLFEKRIVEKQEKYLFSLNDDDSIKEDEPDMYDKFYMDLLEIFANDLKNKGIKFLMISINQRTDGRNYYQLDNFPFIKKKVLELNKNGALDYIDINQWYKNDDDFKGSPVGHYDKRWNYIMGFELSKLIKTKYNNMRQSAGKVRDVHK